MHVLIADAFDLFREGLARALLGTDGAALKISTAYDAASLHDRLSGQRTIDIAIVDLELPQLGGVVGISKIRAHYPLTDVVILGGEENLRAIENAFRVGALGYVPKTSSTAVILAALQLVLAGGMYIPPQVLLHRLSQDCSDERKAPERSPSLSDGTVPPLTERQLEILVHVAKGESNKVIARKLDIADGTVRIHLARIFRALKVKNRTEAVMMTRNLLPGDPTVFG